MTTWTRLDDVLGRTFDRRRIVRGIDAAGLGVGGLALGRDRSGLGPALATLGVFTPLGAWIDFRWPLIVTNSDGKRVLNVGLAAFQDLRDTEWSLLMAAPVLPPILVRYVVAQRLFVEGIAVTGIKG